MEKLKILLQHIEEVKFTGKILCVELLSNRLQDVLYYLEAIDHKASGELIELKGCAWTLHERFHMDNEDQLMWTFHHTRHKIIRSCMSLIESKRLHKHRNLHAGAAPEGDKPARSQELSGVLPEL
ncbi:MAG TPA: hypothetical protein PLQ93_13570 [Bacteroidia bacterium]|nr:hypothetical protein [Bacteroidia bacterium]